MSFRRTLKSLGWNRYSIWGILFVLPAVTFLALFSIYPIINAFILSFYEYDFFRPRTYVGLENYIDLFHSRSFRQSVVATVIYVFGTTVPVWFLALGIALLLNDELPLRNFFRGVVFTPSLMAIVVASIIWKLLFNPYGPVNNVLGTDINWLSATWPARMSVIVMSVWKGTGYYMVIFLAGLQAIPNTYYEAARVDGATMWHRFRYITFPLLKPTTLFIIVISVIIAFRQFVPQYVMTQGGPDNATNVLTLLVYETAFNFSNIGEASAISLIMFAGMMAFSLLQLRLWRED